LQHRYNQVDLAPYDYPTDLFARLLHCIVKSPLCPIGACADGDSRMEGSPQSSTKEEGPAASTTGPSNVKPNPSPWRTIRMKTCASNPPPSTVNAAEVAPKSDLPECHGEPPPTGGSVWTRVKFSLKTWPRFEIVRETLRRSE
jgi:hypothetical protein